MHDHFLRIFFPGKLISGNGTLSQLAEDILQLNPSAVFIATINPLKEKIAGLVATLEKNNIRVIMDASGRPQ